MCIGETFSGKTTTIQVLAKTLNCQIFKLNPKSINTDQLYGFLDPDTRPVSYTHLAGDSQMTLNL